MRYCFSLLLMVLSVYSVKAKVLVIEGHYQGKNLYVSNPIAKKGVGFCVYEVTVNGQVTTDEVNAKTFEIDFTAFKLALGEKVMVTIKHKNGFVPRILNPEVLRPKSTFEVVSMSVKDNTLSWTTKNEGGKQTFFIEQFRWNKWISVGEVEGQGNKEETQYRFQVSPHSGENQFRVKQVDFTGKPRYSSSAFYLSALPKVNYHVDDENNIVTFSHATLYEMYDKLGKIMKKGYDSTISLKGLKRGKYYLNYSNEIATVMVKRNK